MCWVSLCLWLFKIVVWILGASCLYDTPTWVFNKHLKLHLPKVELLVTPQPTKNLLSHLPGCSRKIPRVILNSCLSLSPQPICRQLLLILLPKCVTDSLGSPHHCCCLLVQSPPFLFWTAARVFWPVSMLPRDLCSTKQRESSFKGFSPPLKVITLFEVMSWSSTAVKLKSWPLYPESQSPLDPGLLPVLSELLKLSHHSALEPWAFCFLSKSARQPKGLPPSQEQDFLIFPCWTPSSI